MDLEPGEIDDIPLVAGMNEETMEQDNYLQSRHKEVKKWYNANPDLKNKYGKFPLFWQELNEWEHWKTVDNEFSRFQQHVLEKSYVQEKRNRWADASSLIKRSRWDQDRRYIQPGLNIAITSGLMSIEQVQEIMLRVRVRELTERIDNAEKEADEIAKDPRRSPSPPPIYDSAGNRTNTRAMRLRRSLDILRTELIDEILLLNPSLRAKHHCKFQKKVYIPQDEHPEYNFIGQIMGPRGKSHRNLERQTRTKILVRGRGSTRDGKESLDGLGRDEPLHVIITGDDEEGVNAAEEVIREICKVKDDKVNEYKKAQMRELAIINGQLIEEVICTVCGERGHNQYQCPNRPKSFKPADVMCSICGETSHLTKDCPQRHDKKKIAEMRERDHAYLEFLNELEGRQPEKESSSAPENPENPPAEPSYPQPSQPIPMMPMPNPVMGMMPTQTPPAQQGPVIRPGVIAHAPQNPTWQQQNMMRNMQAMFSFMMQSGMIPPPPPPPNNK